MAFHEPYYSSTPSSALELTGVGTATNDLLASDTNGSPRSGVLPQHIWQILLLRQHSACVLCVLAAQMASARSAEACVSPRAAFLGFVMYQNLETIFYQ